jgi:hypothetical protein
MDSPPRWMPWHRKLVDTVIAEWQRAMQSPEFSGAWQKTRATFHVAMACAPHRQFPLSDKEWDELWEDPSPAMHVFLAAFQQFKAIMPRYIPKTISLYGLNMDRLLRGALLQHCRVTPPPDLGNRLERLSPDNPLRPTPEGALVPWGEEVSNKHYLRL